MPLFQQNILPLIECMRLASSHMGCISHIVRFDILLGIAVHNAAIQGHQTEENGEVE